MLAVSAFLLFLFAAVAALLAAAVVIVFRSSWRASDFAAEVLLSFPLLLVVWSCFESCFLVAFNLFAFVFCASVVLFGAFDVDEALDDEEVTRLLDLVAMELAPVDLEVPGASTGLLISASVLWGDDEGFGEFIGLAGCWEPVALMAGDDDNLAAVGGGSAGSSPELLRCGLGGGGERGSECIKEIKEGELFFLLVIRTFRPAIGEVPGVVEGVGGVGGDRGVAGVRGVEGLNLLLGEPVGLRVPNWRLADPRRKGVL